MNLTNKNLHRILEEIAEKEIERNPLEFIKKEALVFKGNERDFLSYEQEHQAENNFFFAEEMFDVDDDEDNEYHEEENAVVARYTQYLGKGVFGQAEVPNTISIPDSNGNHHEFKPQKNSKIFGNYNYEEEKKTSAAALMEHDKELQQELEDVFHDAKDYVSNSARLHSRPSGFKNNSMDNSLILQ